MTVFLTYTAKFNILCFVKRYRGFIRYLSVVLAMVYALSGGHLFCAHFYHSSTTPPSETDCSHSHCCQTPEERPVSSCCSDGQCHHGCNDNDLPAVLIQRNIDKSEKPIQSFSAGSAFNAFDECLPHPLGFRDVVAKHPPAPSLRLHLVYGVLLI